MYWFGGCVFGVEGELIMAGNPTMWYRDAPLGSETRIGICPECHGPVWHLRRGHIGLYLKPTRRRLGLRYVTYCNCKVTDVNGRSVPYDARSLRL
jgi:hypothetical protein